MFGQVIRALIFLCFMVLAYYLILWVLDAIGLRLPLMVEKIILVILVLVAILVLYQLFAPYIGGVNWWGGPPKPAVALFVAGARRGAADIAPLLSDRARDLALPDTARAGRLSRAPRQQRRTRDGAATRPAPSRATSRLQRAGES